MAVASMGCDVDDPRTAGRGRARPRSGRRSVIVNLEMKALADGGLAHVQAGRVAEGMALLDEAMALACGAADDVSAAGSRRARSSRPATTPADFGRAGSWAELFRRNGLIGCRQPGLPVQPLRQRAGDAAGGARSLGRGGGVARPGQGRVRGRSCRMPSWHPDIALADLRIRQGRWSEAEALLLGKDQAMQALLPAARLHLARGDLALARAAVWRGLRVLGDDRLRAVELLAVLVEAELAAGDVAAAARRRASSCCSRTSPCRRCWPPAWRGRGAGGERRSPMRRSLPSKPSSMGWPRPAAVAARDGAARAGPAAGAGWRPSGRGSRRRRPPRPSSPRRRDRAGRRGAARATDQVVDRQREPGRRADASGQVVDGRLRRRERGCRDSKGLRYLAELVSRPGIERHALDLVDRVEGVADRTLIGAPRRCRHGARHTGSSGLSASHRAAPGGGSTTRSPPDGSRRPRLARPSWTLLVHELAAAFGVGGRDRRASSAAERARLNVTRALRGAIPDVRGSAGLGDALDRRVRTGLYRL